MATLTYGMGVSADGFVAGPNGELDWSAPDPELHRFHNERTRRLEAHLLGRRLYEVMTYWETADRAFETADDELPEVEREFAGIWRELPKLVFSSTLEEVVGNTTLVRGDAVEAVKELKREREGELGVGGPALAHSLIEHDLIDTYELFVAPVVLGAGLPFFGGGKRLDLRTTETHRFGNGVVLLRMERVRA